MPLNAWAVAAVAVDGVLPARSWCRRNVTPAKIAAATSSNAVTASEAITVGRDTRGVLVIRVGAGAGGPGGGAGGDWWTWPDGRLRRVLSSRAKSRQLGYRSAGDLAIARASTGSSTANSGRRCASEGTGAATCLVITTAGLESTYGGAPVNRSKALHASAY